MKIDSLKDLSKYIGSGCTPSRKNALYWNSDDVPWLKTEQLGEYRIYNTNEYVSNAAVKECNMRIYPPNTISLAMYGEGKTRGRVSLIDIPMTTNQACCNIQVDETKADYGYIFYYLRGQYENLRQLSAGVRKNLNADDIKNFNVCYPDNINYQKKISTFLFSIDDKIALNNRVNATLEAMAKTLYDYWFVQFDFPDEKGRPYKTSGGKMVYNEELGREIPAGWEVGNLNVIAEYINGLACQRFRPAEKEDSLPVVKIREIHEGVQIDTERVSANIPDSNIIHDGDILFSWSATLEVHYWIGGKAGLNQHIFKVMPKDGFCREHVYYQLKEYIINFSKIAEARKTTMGHITQDHLDLSRIAIPPRYVMSSFQKLVCPIHERMIKCKQENLRLTALRDWLLPMLMNGQVGFKGECDIYEFI